MTIAIAVEAALERFANQASGAAGHAKAALRSRLWEGGLDIREAPCAEGKPGAVLVSRRPWDGGAPMLCALGSGRSAADEAALLDAAAAVAELPVIGESGRGRVSSKDSGCLRQLAGCFLPKWQPDVTDRASSPNGTWVAALSRKAPQTAATTCWSCWKSMGCDVLQSLGLCVALST
jgi:hypothetical protein